MKTIPKNALKKINHHKSEQGFSLIETMIALTTLGICLAYAMPLFLYAKINNAKSEIRTGALIVSQRVFDDIRSKSISTLPTDPLTPVVIRDTAKTLPSTYVIPGGATVINNSALVTAMGRDYIAKVTYCEVATDCSSKYRKFKVEVNRNEDKVYDLEGTYTEFE
jgi:prepilin-type N-terminal cleavage/methylation domain-containing protein